MRNKGICPKNLFLLFFGLASYLLFSSCNKTYDPVPAYTETIFPTTGVKSRVYYVIDTVYSSATSSFDVNRYYRKEVPNGTETDLTDRVVERLEIFTAIDSTDSLGNLVLDYSFSELWTQYKGETYAERTEGNVRYLPLRFPVFTNLSWNGNLYNNQSVLTYTYTNIDTTVVLNGVTYPNCVFVLQVPFRASGSPAGFYIIEYAWELFAPNIGKIARYKKRYLQNSPTDIDQTSRVFYETMVSHE